MPDQPDPDRFRDDNPALGQDPARAAVEMAEEDMAALAPDRATSHANDEREG